MRNASRPANRETSMQTDLERLAAGKSAVIEELAGGHGMSHRLDALGVRPGKIVTKVSKQIMAGPVIVMVNGRQVAMGRGIARRVLVRQLDGKE